MHSEKLQLISIAIALANDTKINFCIIANNANI